MTTRLWLMWLASERTQRRVDDMLIGAWVGVGLFYALRWMGAIR